MNSLDESKFNQCQCGTKVNSEQAIEKDIYSWLGWFFWSMGTTAVPTKVSFVCKNCHIEFEKITDRELIKYYMLYKRK